MTCGGPPPLPPIMPPTSSNASPMQALPPHQPQRLDRLISHTSGLSRSQVRRLLKAGAVTVDGQPCLEPDRAVTAGNRVALDGVVLAWPRAHYLMLHKPPGYVCAEGDATHPSVTSLVQQPWAATLHSAGRLDADTTGLVLLTDDGDWSHRLTSPRRHCSKRYRVQLRHPLQSELVQRFAAGLLLNGDAKPTLPAQLELLGSHTARVTLHEGRYHQVKRMFAACSNRVEALHRESIGALQLDPSLQPGQWRELDADEIRSVDD